MPLLLEVPLELFVVDEEEVVVVVEVVVSAPPDGTWWELRAAAHNECSEVTEDEGEVADSSSGSCGGCSCFCGSAPHGPVLAPPAPNSACPPFIIIVIFMGGTPLLEGGMFMPMGDMCIGTDIPMGMVIPIGSPIPIPIPIPPMEGIPMGTPIPMGIPPPMFIFMFMFMGMDMAPPAFPMFMGMGTDIPMGIIGAPPDMNAACCCCIRSCCCCCCCCCPSDEVGNMYVVMGDMGPSNLKRPCPIRVGMGVGEGDGDTEEGAVSSEPLLLVVVVVVVVVVVPGDKDLAGSPPLLALAFPWMAANAATWSCSSGDAATNMSSLLLPCWGTPCDDSTLLEAADRGPRRAAQWLR